MLEGFAHCEMLFDDRGRPIDFVYLAVNGAFGKLTGLANVVGKKFSEVVRGARIRSQNCLRDSAEVALPLGQSDLRSKLKPWGCGFSISAYGAGNGALLLRSITS